MNILNKIKQFINSLLNNNDNENLLLYITGNEALPTPLSPEEEIAAISQLSAGNVQIKNLLIERNLRLVVYIARKFDNTGIDVEDLISVGTIGLIKAVNSFAPDKNIKLATYASRCIENEILMYLRRMVRQKAEISLDEPLNVDYEGNELLIGDILGTDPDLVSKDLENSVEKQLLWNAINKLGGRERTIMQLRFGLNGKEERTQREVAEYLGISQSYISRLEKKIINRLKREIVKTI